ncbi:hypothetical protein SAMN05421747_101404 [Parapedobacter composti]|uniref:N-formylglutamate amidohydrolase n=1 Tax=Parapedobacter composti TaxID=623281 RepID=A0A1I1E9C1_9SPHI|nr:N-formylglutamate amidohydrolase [Parapedobacter composti]SFB83306.1 hypothetical protein SAMN05421747_101404 [Parapedobacter composti]
MKEDAIKKIQINYMFQIALLPLFFLLVQCKKDDGDDGAPQPPVAHHWQAGQVFFDEPRWTECVVGDMPLIISAPHGGAVRPAHVPDRTCPNATVGTDLYTMELARDIAEELYQTYGVRPYLIINHLHRIKIDQNREINEATCGNEEMKVIWHNFHHYIDTALATAVNKFGRALYIDLHGHAHEKHRLELGYRLNASDLGHVYTNTNITALTAKSTLVNLVGMAPSFNLRDLIIGDHAFGTLMANEGVPSVPSKQDPYPMSGEPFFNGGYNSDRYTSVHYPGVYGFQIECHRPGVRNPEDRPEFAKKFAKVVVDFLEKTKP